MIRATTSASNLFRRALCPGSARMEAGLPEEDSDISREGQLLHDYYAHPEYERGVLKPKQRDLVELADTLSSIVIERCKENLVGEFVEYREVDLKTQEGLSGTPDRLLYYADDRAMIIIDPKFGYNVVERAEVNLQLRAYAVMGYDFTELKVRNIFVSIVQPRLSFEERITIANYTPSDIEDSRREIKAILRATEAPDAELVAGEEQCRYCKAKMTCPAFKQKMMVPNFLTPDNALSVAARTAYLEQKLAEISDEQLDKMLQAVRLAALVRNPAFDEARKRIAEGKLSEYTVAKDSEVRTIANVQGAIARLVLSGVMTKDRLLSIAEIPLGPIEDEYRKSTNCTWKEAREKINKVLASVIEVETRKGRLIRK